MKRIVLATAGSLGDLHPFLAIAVGLLARGHEVTIATAEFYRSNVFAEGLQFAKLRGVLSPETATAESTRRAFDRWGGTRFLLKERILPHLEQTYEDLRATCLGADVLVSHPSIVAAPLVAEKLGLRWISCVLSPMTLLSAYDPPVLPPAPWLQRLRSLGSHPHRVVHGALKAAVGKLMEPLARLRQREGLRPRSGAELQHDMFSSQGTLALFSPMFAAPQEDWPRPTHVAGFPMYNRCPGEEKLDAKLREFLAAGSAPIIFTLGSAAVVDAADFFEQSTAAVGRLGRRVVLLAGREKRHQLLRSPDVFVASYASYSEVFPNAAVVVHQGGIGTAAQVLHAGVPSLVVPFGLDQPDNANRLRRLGVARVLARGRYNAESAYRHLSKLIEETVWSDAARRVSELIRREDGVSEVCDAVEKVCREGSL